MAKLKSKPRAKRAAPKRSRSRRTEPAPLLREHKVRRRRVLAVDVGNTDTVVGLMLGLDVLGFWRLTTRRQTTDEVRQQLRALMEAEGDPVAGVDSVLCSVAPSLTDAWLEALQALTGRAPLEVDHRTASLPIRYRNPSSIGADRLANAVAACEIYGAPAIVVDMGTSTNFDCVSEAGAFMGGALAPGLASSVDVLAQRAARLPRIELHKPARVLGRTTEEAMQSGFVNGFVGLVEAIVGGLSKEMKGEPHVIATGGLAKLIAADCPSVQAVDEGLTLKGMVLIRERNS